MNNVISTLSLKNRNVVRSIFLTASILFVNVFAIGQNIAINTDGSKANPNAIVDIKSTTKGLLIPRMTTSQRVLIPQTNGMLVYDLNTKSFWFSNGQVWQNMVASTTTSDAWLLTGNAGTVDSTNFIGTTDN